MGACAGFPVYAIDGDEVMGKALATFYYQGGDQRARAHMSIVDKQGRERVREMTLLRKNLDGVHGKQKYYVYFSKPSDVSKMVFMAWKNVVRDDDRWLYLPALDLVKRIAASDERASFVGSNFFYEDVSGRGLVEDDHRLVGETDAEYIVSSVPKVAAAVEFSRYQVWVDKASYLPMKIEYYDASGAVYRVYRTLAHEVIDSYATVTQATMADLRTGGVTTIDYSAIHYSNDIPEDVFTERYLRRPPKQYLRTK